MHPSSTFEDTHFRGTVLLSEDGGETWRRGGDFDIPDNDPGPNEPTVVELKNGDLYCLMRTSTGYQYESRSADGGLTWSDPKPSIFASPSGHGYLLRLSGGPLVFVWNDRVSPQPKESLFRTPLTIALSDDDGQTWPYRKMIQATPQGELSNHGVCQTGSDAILVSYNRGLGRWDGAEHGNVELARFDEAWIRSDLSTEQWEQHPAASGGIRLDPDGLVLVSGIEAKPGNQTVLASRTALPGRCVLEYEITDVVEAPDTYNGLFLGAPPWEGASWFYIARTRTSEGARIPGVCARYSGDADHCVELSSGLYYDATTVCVTFADGRVRYEDSTGVQSEWINLPEDIRAPVSWGFFTRNTGQQGRMKLRNLRISEM